MLREIAARLGVQIDDQKLTGFMGALDVAKSKLLGFGTVLGAGLGLHFIAEQIEFADTLGDTAERLGVTTDELQRFQYALQLTGGESEQAEKAIFLFNKTLGAAAEAGGANPFEDLKISIKDANGQVRPMLDLLPEVADKVAEAGSEAERTAIAVKFFGKSGLALLPMLKRGAEGIKELNDEFTDLGGGITADAIARASEVSDQMHRFKTVTRALIINALSVLLPMLQKLATWTLTVAAKVSYLAQHTNVLKVGLAFISVLLAAKFIPILFSAVRAFMALRVAVLGASVPFWLLAAVVAVLFLIFEDLFTLITGGDSLIGKLLDSMLGVGTSKKVVEALKDAWMAVQAIWIAVKEDFLKGLSLNWELLKKDIAAIIAFFKEAIAAKRELFGQEGKREVTGSAADKLLHPEAAANGGGNVGGIASNTFGQGAGVNALIGGGSLFDAISAVGVAGNKGYLPNLSGIKVGQQNVSTQVTVNVPAGTAPGAVPAAVTAGVKAGVAANLQDAYGALKTSVAPGTAGGG